jgi:hypothetical protein
LKGFKRCVLEFCVCAVVVVAAVLFFAIDDDDDEERDAPDGITWGLYTAFPADI